MASQLVLSNWFDVESVPKSHIFPPKSRAGKLPVSICDTIPLIDLSKSVGLNRSYIIQQISEACQEFGFFQVINHGVNEDLINETVQVLKEFFNIPDEDKASVPNKGGWIYTSSLNHTIDGGHLWRDNIKHPCQPLDECVQLWPENPTNYRKIVADYVTELRKLSLRILELICEGLGLEPGYFESSEVQLLSSNNYPPCPDPSLTLGVPRHRDPSLITILFEGDVSGLQVFKNGQWIGVRALHNAFIVNVGNQLEIISNRKLISAEHRAVTNSSERRTSIATFINPSLDCIVEPAKILVDESNPPLYKPTMYKDFVSTAQAFGVDTKAIQNRISSENS